MNRHLHRLVFDAARGMRVAVAEDRRSQRKAASAAGGAALPALAAALCAAACPAGPAQAQTAPARPPVVFAGKAAAPVAPLPRPYGSTFGASGAPVNAAPRPFVYDPAKGAGAADLSKTGQVRWTVNGRQATFDQGQVDRVVINWDSFNIGAGYGVEFVQNPDPSKYVSALNRVWSSDPSVILGTLRANRELIVLNANGVYFGRGAIVDTGKFIASSLSLADSVFEKGLRNVVDGSPVFTTAGADYLPTNLDGAVTLEDGAQIRSAAGGDVLLVAPRVVNQGRIDTPAGQTVLAAGDKVYLMSSADPAQRGLIVAVDAVAGADGRPDPTLGVVENAARGSFTAADATGAIATRLNEIRADSGSVNLVGLLVRQNGAINATTAVKGANGAIFLQGMASTVALNGDPADASGVSTRGLLTGAGTVARVGARLGTVEIGAGSVTAVRPSSSGATQLDAEVFNPSRIHVEGAAIGVAGGAEVLAPGGRIELLAARDATGNPTFTPGETLPAPADDSRIVLAPGATLSAAGLRQVEVDGSRNQGTQRLFRIELADSPLQRSGPLYRSELSFDLRDAGGISAADVTGSKAAIGRTAEERATAGGSIGLRSGGALVVGHDTLLDVSGGSVHYGAAVISSSVVLQDGRAVTFAKAAGSRAIDALLPASQQTTVPAYTAGADGGALTLVAQQAVLDGALAGRTVLGERQAAGLDKPAAPATLTLGTASGSAYALPSLRLAPEAGTPLADAWFADVFGAPLPSLPGGAELSLRRVADGGFGQLALHAASITQPAFGSLDLGPGGSLTIDGSTVQLDAAFRSAGGTMAVTSTLGQSADGLAGGDIQVSGRSVLDTSARWIHPSAGEPATADGIDGGRVTLTAAHGLQVDAGARLDVSGGALLTADGKLSQGKAGRLKIGSGAGLDSGTWPPTRLDPGSLSIAGVQLRGFDFGDGGQLELSAPALSIGGEAPADGIRLDPALFGSGGFGQVSLHSAGAVRVASGTTLAPLLQNWQFDEGWRTQAGGAMSTVALPAVTDRALADRKPVNLAVDAVGSLSVERGAAIVLDAGGRLSLTAGQNLLVGATGPQDQRSLLAAPGGSLTLAVSGARSDPSGETDKLGFIPDQSLWLGTGADLTVAGVALLRRQPASARPAQVTFGSVPEAAPQDRIIGSVLGGGTVALNASRGYVVAQAGSTIDLDGRSARLNVDGVADPVTVARSAGTLSVSTPEGFALEGRVSARAPVDAAGHALADGGSLSLAVGRYGVWSGSASSGLVGQPYDTGPRTLSVGGDELRLDGPGAAPGVDLSTLLGNGIGHVRASLLHEAGWGALTLAAGDRVNFTQSLSLDLPLGLTVDAPAIAAQAGAKVDVRAGAAQLGDAGHAHAGAAPDTSARADTAADGSTSLRVAAPSIDVYGNLGLQGFSSVALEASGEIRFTADAPEFRVGNSLQRRLAFAGELRLTAGQVYATSTTQYTLQGLDGSTVVLRRPLGGDPQPTPLSAYGSLAISATDIDQGGVLRQPWGRITLTAGRTLTLGEGSVTSVAADGAAMLYGQTLNLGAWVLPGGDDAFFAPADHKAVTLNAPQIVTAPGASVSAAGGGTLRAWEFFPGVGGSTDYFSTSGLYAVLPDHGHTQSLRLEGGIVAAAGYGQQIVVTQGGSGLVPGRYTLLPARAALLGDLLPQGAFLVSRAADQGSSLLRGPLAQDDGSVLVTGYLTRSGSVQTGLPGERWVVERPASFAARSDIRLTDVSTLLSTRAAAGLAVPGLPRDAGAVTLKTGNADPTRWTAEIDLAGHGGSAGTLDVAGTRLALVDELSKAGDATLAITAGTLQRSAAGSILVGGVRSAADDACAPVCVDAGGTRSVDVDLGTQPLQVRELLVAATERVSVAAGSRLAAVAGDGARRTQALAVKGDGALLALSADALDLHRTGTTPGNGAVLALGAGSEVSGAVVDADSSGLLQLDASARLAGTAVGLGAGHLVVGTPATPDGAASVLDGRVLDTARAASDLSLSAYESLDFAGDQRWVQRTSGAATVKQRLVLDAPVLRGVVDAGGKAAQVDIAAQDLVLRNSSGRGTGEEARGAGAAGESGSGTLLLQALPPLRYGDTGGITLGPGAVSLGFEQAALRSSGDIVLAGSGSTWAQGDLLLSAARVTAQGGADQAVTAAGRLQIAAEAGSRTLGEARGYGARVVFSGATLDSAGRIDLPGGRLVLQATGGSADGANLVLAAPSLASVAGFQFKGSDGSVADGDAGSIELRADTGRIAWLGTLDVRAARKADGTPAGGDAGSVTLQATGEGGALELSQAAQQGRLLAAGGSEAGDRGGRLTADLRTMPQADAFVQLAQAGGASDRVGLRVREGDLALSTGLRARQITLAADAGTLTLGGAAMLDARAVGGGQVQLAAGRDLVLQAGVQVEAGATTADGRGGDVLLSSRDGRIRLDATAQVGAADSTGAGGRIVLRAQRDDEAPGVAVDPLVAAHLQAADVAVEAVRVYSGVDTISFGFSGDNVLGQTTVLQDSAAFMRGADRVRAALGLAGADAAHVQLRPGVEVRAEGDLTVDGDWNLAASRPGGAAGFLTLRAAGDINLLASLSDGFAGVLPTAPLLSDPAAWSMRLSAGADLGAALPTAITRDAAASLGGAGDLTIAAGARVRTGNGRLDLAAARDVIFGIGDEQTPPGQAYVAGRALGAAEAPDAALFQSMQARPAFTSGGGDLTLTAGRDIVAPEATQLVNNWYWRSGIVDAASGQYQANAPLAWWSQFSRFSQTLGHFGGGDIDVAAGRDVINLQAFAPTRGWADSRDAPSAQVHTLDGGEVEVQAGRDLLGGQFMIGRGTGRLHAAGKVGMAPDNIGTPQPVLALNDGRWRVSGREGVTVSLPFTPTAAPASASDNRAGLSGHFYTWGGDAGLTVVSNAGSVVLPGAPGEGDASTLGLAVELPGALSTLQVSAPSLQVAAAGDVALLEGSGQAVAVMFPSAQGQLSLWAGGDVRLGASGEQLAMADSAPALWGTVRAPGLPQAVPAATLVPATLADSLPLAGLHAGDTQPVQVHAERDLKILGASGGAATLQLAKPAQLSAGADAVQLSTRIVQFSADDLSSVTVGRNLLAGLDGSIELAGPGSLEVSAGRNIDLGASRGIVTTGNRRSAALPAQGAAVRVSAATEGTLSLALLQSRYLVPAAQGGSARSEQHRAALLAFVREALQAPGLGYDEAWAQFQAFPAAQQARFGRQVLASEFSAVYLAAAPTGEAAVSDALREAFERDKAGLLAAGEAALAAGQPLVLPGREAVAGTALRSYLDQIRSLAFTSLDLAPVLAPRLAQLQAIALGWRQQVAATLGASAAELDALLAASPGDPRALQYQAALADTTSRQFEAYRQQVLASELADAGALASLYGRKSLPMRLALFEQGFQAAELAGVGSAVSFPVWSPQAPLLAREGSLDMTQSSVVTERGGAIGLFNPGGGISVGLKDNAGAAGSGKGVIALGGGNVLGYARDDFQVNTQRVFVVGAGDMTVWSSAGDIDSGRGANTAVAAPPLQAQRGADGVQFVVPATTTGSGLGILADASGTRAGTIGLYPAFGEILALDAFIRAPSLVLGSTVKGADNLIAGSVAGAAAPVAAPALNVAAPTSSTANQRATDAQGGDAAGSQKRPGRSLLTVDLLGLGSADGETCTEQAERERKCLRPAAPAAP